jgi:hypothetical protein
MMELGPYSAILTGGKAQSLLSRVVNSVIVQMLINVIVDNVNVVNEDNPGQDRNVNNLEQVLPSFEEENVDHGEVDVKT